MIWVVVAVVLVGGAYMLLSRSPMSSEEEELADLDYLFDYSVTDEVLDALNETLLASVAGGLDQEALAAEANELNNLPDVGGADEIFQYANEFAQ